MPSRKSGGSSRLRTRIRVSLVAAAILLLGTPARALNPALEINQYAHSVRTTLEGGFRGAPSSFAQTIDGYLWIGTEFGVLRFDGVRLVMWEPPRGERLPSPSVVELLSGRDGSLWIGTTRGLARMRNGHLTTYGALADQYVGALLEGTDGAIWAATSAGLAGAARLCIIEPAGATRCEATRGELGRLVLSLYRDRRGNIWVGAASGLWRWAPGKPYRYPLGDARPEVHSMAEDEDGTLLLTLGRDILQLTDDSLSRHPIGRDIRELKPTALLRDRHGGLWIGTQDRGLLHVNTRGVDNFRHADGLSADFVSDIFEDREGNVWVATPGGFDQFRDLAVATFSTRHGLTSNSTTSVLADAEGGVWLGTASGLSRWHDGWIKTQVLRELGENTIGTLFLSRDKRMWISSSAGLRYLQNGRLSPWVVRSGYVQAMTEDRAGNLWISDQERGLIRVRGTAIVEAIPWTAFGDRHARTLTSDPTRDGIWLGFFEGGLAYVEEGQVRESYTVKDGLGGGTISHLAFDDAGTLWVSTDEGLTRFRNRRVMTLTTSNGLPCNTAHWSIEDDQRSLWVRTSCGLVRMLRPSIDAWSDPSQRMALTVFDDLDGVPSRLSIGSYGPKATRTRNGELWFTTSSGVGVIDPDAIPPNQLMPYVHIEQITVRRTEYSMAPAQVPPLLRDLRIDYTALSLTSPSEVRFRYRLEGHDSEWVDAGSRRQAFYTDLDPGSYRFQVIAANSDGVWNNTGAVWAFIVQPAFYQTRSFKLTMTITAIVILSVAYRIRVNRVAEMLRARFEERLAERNRIARELHDTLLQGLVSASMQLHVVADHADPMIRPKLVHILGRIGQVIEEGRRSVQGLRSWRRSADLEGALARDAEYLRMSQPIQIRLTVEGPKRPLQPLARDEIYRIAREAVVNAFRHAQPHRLEINIEYGGNHLRVRVVDDGRGIAPETLASGLSGHYGMRGMRERADQLGATLKIRSRVASGTEIDLFVPGDLAFERPTRRWWSRWPLKAGRERSPHELAD